MKLESNAATLTHDMWLIWPDRKIINLSQASYIEPTNNGFVVHFFAGTNLAFTGPDTMQVYDLIRDRLLGKYPRCTCKCRLCDKDEPIESVGK